MKNKKKKKKKKKKKNKNYSINLQVRPVINFGKQNRLWFYGQIIRMEDQHYQRKSVRQDLKNLGEEE